MEQSLYIHIPFCKRTCPYCDFYSRRYSVGLAKDYVQVLCEQLNRLKGAVVTIYIGGGTPSVMSMELWESLLKSLRRFVQAAQECTVEVNPESFTKGLGELFFDAGLNRISIGVQSLREKKLQALGRIHTAEQGRRALLLAHSVGFKNISADLIFGVWNETVTSWRNELQEIVSFPLTHISTYALTYEKGTALYGAVESGKIMPLAEAQVAKLYRLALRFLPKHSFPQYEVSSFAHEGDACRHNMRYWRNSSCIALGPSAVSYRNGVRRRNVSRVGAYVNRFKAGKSLVTFQESRTGLRRAKETAALLIRTAAGIRSTDFKVLTGFDFFALEKTVLPELLSQGMVEYVGLRRGIRLTEKGFLFADAVSSAFL